nr:cellulase family glycosylhydrolase [uncultured Cohaesibacter sp.]
MNSNLFSPWTRDRAQAWWQGQGWPCGFNYLPSSAVNFLEMWMADRFDAEEIARELKWAADIGFNSVRTNLHYLIWKHDRDGLLARLETFLRLAAECGLSTMPVLFDDCGFGGAEPVYGPQPEPVPGIHNSRAVASPGRAAVMDQSLWPDFEAYVKDIISRFADDDRILMWDLYNEPGNRMIFSPDGSFSEYDPALGPQSEALMAASFDWARSVAPSQPLTVGAWRTPAADEQAPPYDNSTDQLALALSDVVTFHAYCDLEHLERYVADLAPHRRPLLCTEWMARSVGSRFDALLPYFHDTKIGCYNWGMIKGRTQTNLPWPNSLTSHHGANDAVDTTAEWFHDVLHADGTPYDESETALISRLCGKTAA